MADAAGGRRAITPRTLETFRLLGSGLDAVRAELRRVVPFRGILAEVPAGTSGSVLTYEFATSGLDRAFSGPVGAARGERVCGYAHKVCTATAREREMVVT